MTSKFEKKLWHHNEVNDKGKLRYYREVINLNLKEKKYPSIIASLKKKTYSDKSRTN
jgi:hypothetical protein